MTIFNGVGIDVSNHHVRLAEVSLLRNVLQTYEIVLEEGLVRDEQVVDVEGLAKVLKQQLKKTTFSQGVRRTTLLVPESRVLSSGGFFEKRLRGSALDEVVTERAQQDIPLPFKDAYVSISCGGKEAGKVRTTLYASQKEVIDGLRGVIDSEQFRLVAMEANSKALLRLFFQFASEDMKPCSENELVGIVDVGHSWTTVSFYTPSGSNVLSRTLSHPDAVQQGGKNDGKLPVEVLDNIRTTISESVVYFKQHEQVVSTVVLAGVEAYDDMVLEEISKSGGEFQVVRMGEVVKLSGLKPKDIHTFGAAIGAALRAVRPWRYNYQHNFSSK